MLNFTTGDMFKVHADIRVNTVNCVGVMGAGVALAFKTRLPDMFREYKAMCDAGELIPGKLHIWKNLTGDWVINFPTKRHWREKSRYEDIESGLVALREYLKDKGPVRVTLPALGCGHGGLDWAQVRPMIESYLKELQAEIFVFDPADSREIAKKESEALFGRALRVIKSDEKEFPDVLKHLGIKEIFSVGSSPHRMNADVAIALSSKPSEREESAALSCVEELAKPGATFAFVFGSAISTKLASAILAKGANVAGWVPQGLSRYHLPEILKRGLSDGHLVLFSIARSEQGWNPKLASRSTLATLSASRANLVTDPEPNWLIELIQGDSNRASGSMFYINYQTTPPHMLARWDELAAHPIKRRSTDGKPNLSRMLDRLETEKLNAAH